MGMHQVFCNRAASHRRIFCKIFKLKLHFKILWGFIFTIPSIIALKMSLSIRYRIINCNTFAIKTIECNVASKYAWSYFPTGVDHCDQKNLLTILVFTNGFSSCFMFLHVWMRYNLIFNHNFSYFKQHAPLLVKLDQLAISIRYLWISQSEATQATPFSPSKPVDRLYDRNISSNHIGPNLNWTFSLSTP